MMTSLARLWLAGSLLLLAGTVRCAIAAEPTPPSKDPHPLLPRAADGTEAVTGLRQALDLGALPRWPVRLSPINAVKRCTGTACTEWERLDLALNRAAEWMAAYDGPLRLDAAMGLVMIRESVDNDALRRAFERARKVGDGDHDNPQRRFWTPDFTAPVEHTSRWTAPATPGTRINTNRVIEEALFCDKYGWRQQTIEYVCGPMRDDGGYHSTHALWALFIANRHGCIPAAKLDPCLRSIHAEIATHQPDDLAPKSTLDIDLYAQRLLTVVMTGYPDPVVNGWASTLLRLQQPDGSWGVKAAGEDPYYRYHATFVSTWALAEWYRRRVGIQAVRPDAAADGPPG